MFGNKYSFVNITTTNIQLYLNLKVLKSLEMGKWLPEENYEETDFSPAVQVIIIAYNFHDFKQYIKTWSRNESRGVGKFRIFLFSYQNRKIVYRKIIIFNQYNWYENIEAVVLYICQVRYT